LLIAAGLAASLVLAHPARLRAQSVRDAVKQHVKTELDRTKEKKKEERKREAEREEKEKRQQKPPARPEPARPEPARPAPATADETKGKKPANRVEIKLGGEPEKAPPEGEKPKDDKPKPPFRVFGKDFKVDLKLGAGYRGWIPQQYPNVEVDMASYFTWTVSARAKVFKWLVIHRAYYESSGLSGPRTEEAAVAAEIGSFAPKAAWVLGMLGFPIFKVWEPVISYESRAFNTTARSREPEGVCPVSADFEGELDACARVEKLRIVSGFETLVAGVRYNHHKDPSPVIQAPKGKVPPIFFGIGLMSYTKPYQVTIEGATLEGLLFDGRFRGIGLAGGTELGGGVYRFYADIDLQIGLGEVSLTEDLTLNELAPEGWLIGYVQGNATVGYRVPIWRFAPTLIFVPSVSGGGASFFFFETNPEEGEEGTTAAVNWDFLWTVRGSFVLTL
jgi:hypothetical protein